MSLYDMAVNILNSDMDINLKKIEIGKLRNQSYSHKVTMSGLSVFCIVFGITILPLFLLPFTLKIASLHKKQIKQIDELLLSLDVTV